MARNISYRLFLLWKFAEAETPERHFLAKKTQMRKVSYYYTVSSDDVKVLKSRWNLVNAKTTTHGNNIYTLLITFTPN